LVAGRRRALEERLLVRFDAADLRTDFAVLRFAILAMVMCLSLVSNGISARNESTILKIAEDDVQVLTAC